MSIHSEKGELLVLARPNSLAQNLGYALANVVDRDLAARSAVVDAVAIARRAPLNDLSDDDLEEGFVQQIVELTTRMQRAVAERDRILMIGSGEHLGDWNNAVAASHDAAVIGIMRSLALEHMRRGISINILTLPNHQTAIEDALDLATGLLASQAVSGQVLIVDGANSLRLAKAQPRKTNLQ